jgi:hypothetical protein
MIEKSGKKPLKNKENFCAPEIQTLNAIDLFSGVVGNETPTSSTKKNLFCEEVGTRTNWNLFPVG